MVDSKSSLRSHEHSRLREARRDCLVAPPAAAARHLDVTPVPDFSTASSARKRRGLVEPRVRRLVRQGLAAHAHGGREGTRKTMLGWDMNSLRSVAPRRGRPSVIRVSQLKSAATQAKPWVDRKHRSDEWPYVWLAVKS
ncbi:hypothetical protein NL676_030231 [Syzygium grande]|nr:hypothetical protein NL676_030231 [Syzygium grande]